MSFRGAFPFYRAKFIPWSRDCRFRTSLVFETLIGAGLGDALSHGQVLGVTLFLHRGILLPMAAIALLALLPLLFERIIRKRREAVARAAPSTSRTDRP